ncbi:MAG: APC family permease [Candidatus Omnitrophota bacterium]
MDSHPETKLRAGALKLPSIMMQGITHIAPAIGLIFSIQFVTSLAGVTTPLSFAIAFVIILTLGFSLNQLARHLPCAGGYYTYVSRTVHPRAGFLTAWLYFLYDPAGTAINLAFMGYFLQQTLNVEYNVFFPWWLFFIIAALLISWLVYRGIELSAEIMLFLGAAEILIVVALVVTGLFQPGNGGINLASYNPANATSMSGLYLGVVFSIFSFTGFESVAPLAEESENPRKNLPKAIIGSILLTGAFYLFCSWALLVGWGTNDLKAFIDCKESPTFVLARKLWGGAWILVLLAVFNSIMAVSIACTNAATRVFYAMGRSESLPRALAKIHPVYQTPMNAIKLQTAITLLLGLGVGFWIGPDQEFFLMAAVTTLGMILVYSAGNLGVYRFYRSEQKAEFNVFFHAIFPFVSTVALIWVGYKSVVPLPQTPICYAPFIVAAWLIIGAALLWIMYRRGRESWLLKAGQAAYEQGVSTDEK